jgi:hypothetical protein
MNKKAALELSINAIVVLILAITILGLGIGFIRSQFGALGKQFTEVSSEIRSQLIEKIKESGDLLVFNRAELAAGIGKKDVFYIGIKNTGSNANPDKDSICFRTGIRCIRALNPDNECTPLARENAVVGGILFTQGAEERPNPDYKWFELFEQADIRNNDVGVFPINLQIAKAKPDTYAMELVVYKGSDDCAAGGGIWETRPYQSKQFFVVLT